MVENYKPCLTTLHKRRIEKLVMIWWSFFSFYLFSLLFSIFLGIAIDSIFECFLVWLCMGSTVYVCSSLLIYSFLLLETRYGLSDLINDEKYSTHPIVAKLESIKKLSLIGIPLSLFLLSFIVSIPLTFKLMSKPKDVTNLEE